MKRVQYLKNTILNYAWGSYTAIPELLGQPSPAEAPCAEMWIGAHPKAPSMVEDQSKRVPLDALIAENPEMVLGKKVAADFEGKLPFLFKVLAAARPLSIQAHPNKSQAVAGFARENRAGIPMDSPKRNYRDDNHKPECICALSEFHALCGFRSIEETVFYLNRLYPDGGNDVSGATIRVSPDDTDLRRFFKTLMQLPSEHAVAVVNRAVKNAGHLLDDDPVFELIVRLHQDYPGDIGVLAPAFLNFVTLSPGQAMFLPAGILHAYLGGTGLELMANSDNVLRGGLTPKHVEVPELLNVLDFSEMTPAIVTPEALGPCEQAYTVNVSEFVLSVIVVEPEMSFHDFPACVAILLCTEGSATIRESTSGVNTPIQKGQSVIIHAAAGEYSISGMAVLYKASVPL